MYLRQKRKSSGHVDRWNEALIGPILVFRHIHLKWEKKLKYLYASIWYYPKLLKKYMGEKNVCNVE